MRTFLLRPIVILVIVCPSLANGQIVRGTVTERQSGTPLRSVNLGIYSTGGRRLVSGMTNQDGNFEIVLPKGNTVYLQADLIGYETVKSKPITARTSEIIQLNVHLGAVAIPLQAIDVVSRKTAEPRLQPFLDRASLYKRAGIGRIWTRSDLEKERTPLISGFIMRLPQRIEKNPFGRGKQICAGTVFYVDDVRVGVEDDDATPEDLDGLVAPEQIEGIEMYRDTDVPPDMLSNIRRFNHTPLQSDIDRGILTPPTEAPEYYCMMVMIWRKPYSELQARRPIAHAPAWQRAATWTGFAVGLFLVERVWQRR